MITYSQLNNKGRLGNQLFQIASTIGMAHDIGQDFCFPKWEYQHCFKNELPSCDSISPQAALKERYCDYSPIPEDLKEFDGDLDIDGYFQSEKYFLNAKEKVQHYFEFNDEVVDYVKNKYEIPLKEYDTTIHVRRGDYLNLRNVYHVLSHLYYFKATSMMSVKKAVVFSDDIAWCKQVFKDTDCFFVSERPHDSYEVSYTSSAERNAKGFTFEDVCELALMSMFKNNIIANSTFGWWAGWLNNTPQKCVIAPRWWYHQDRLKIIASPEKTGEEYMKDIIPESWTIA